METGPSFSSLLPTLKLDGPWVPSKTWESIPSESGEASLAVASSEPQDPNYESSSISEANLIHLVLNALLGVKSSIMEIDKISEMFSSSPADRTCHRIPTIWCRSLSTNALGKLLKCMSHSGLVVSLLQKFVDFYLCATHDVKGNGNKGGGSSTRQEDTSFSDILKPPANGKVGDADEIWMYPPYSLVNQAFAVAVKKVLQGYFGALNTLQASIKLRRSIRKVEKSAHVSDKSHELGRNYHSGITVLEVLLHTTELRTQIESLGNICFPRFANLALSMEALMAEPNLQFHNFPRGVDLLSYLYVQLRDADQIHQPLLKLLFVSSCEPFCGFIKSWIFQASIKDPYKEFFVDKLTESSVKIESVDDYFSTEIKEQVGILVPCFLRDFHCSLVRAGLQLQVLVKFLSLFNLAVGGGRTNAHHSSSNIEEILPFWAGMSTDLAFLPNSLTFSKQRIEELIHQRQNMYQMMLEKLRVFFSKSDIQYQRMNHTVIPFGNAPNLFTESSPSIPIILLSDGSYIFSTTTDELEASKIDTIQNDIDASYTSDESSDDLELLHSSESSSSYSSEEEIKSKRFFNPGNDVSQTEYFLHSNSSSCYERKILSPNSIGSRWLCPDTPLSVHHMGEKMNGSSISIFCGNERSSSPVLIDEDYNSDKCRPVGFPNNLFNDIMKYRGSREPCFVENSILVAHGIPRPQENTKSAVDEFLLPFQAKLDTVSRFEFLNAINEHRSWEILSSFNSNHRYDLNANPTLTRISWFSNMDKSEHTSSNIRHQSHFPHFDFSSVVDPCSSLGSMLASSDHRLQVEPSRLANFDLAVGSNGMSTNSVQNNIKKKTDSYPFCSSDASKEAQNTSRDLPTGISGGAAWVGSLQNSSEDISICAEDKWHASAIEFEMPLDVMIDKCILQEILLQYKYVSNFTIKLLEEGFDLHEHLLALRRYHFMELADWADAFIVSICKKKWPVIEPEKKIAEIQGLLELALQRSSCETDQYKERLYVYMNSERTVLSSSSVQMSGLDIFDFMLLGYRVDWPIRIIVTPDALKIYAEIFRYLIKVKLAAFSLTEVWSHIKALMHSALRGQVSKFQVEVNILMKLRQQMGHFLSALQQYLYSQLSNVSWCRFQHSLKNQVKDMLDLESVHMSYLAEALHICFLSDEMKPVAAIIKNILQCVLDFGLCLTRGDLYSGSDGVETLNSESHVSISEVLTIKTTFGRYLKDLHLLYLRSPKHVEFSLCRFWDHLNYNEYYSDLFNKEMGYIYM